MIMVLTAVLFLPVGMAVAMFGAGGSFLAVPILYYLLGVGAHEAIVLGLVVVAAASLISFLYHRREGATQFKVVLLMGVAGSVIAYIGGLLSPFIAEQVLLIAYGILLLCAGVVMTCPKKNCARHEVSRRLESSKLIAVGAGVGFLTGLLGAGGGFLILPMLMVYMRVPMKDAVASSALIVMLQSSVSLLAHTQEMAVINVALLSVLIVSVGLGLVIGFYVNKRIDQTLLSLGFAWLLIALAASILIYQIYVYASTMHVMWLLFAAMIVMAVLLVGLVFRSANCFADVYEGR